MKSFCIRIRMLAISKSDLLDEELKAELREELPKDKLRNGDDMPVIFISSVANDGLMELKDQLWKILNN